MEICKLSLKISTNFINYDRILGKIAIFPKINSVIFYQRLHLFIKNKHLKIIHLSKFIYKITEIALANPSFSSKVKNQYFKIKS